jgi:hypothetical protein
VCSAALCWYLTNLLLNLVASGSGYVDDLRVTTGSAIDSTISDGHGRDAATIAASWLDRFAHSTLGDVTFATERFQLLVLVSLIVGAVAWMSTVRRCPLQMWPEIVWLGSAALALLPALALHVWLFVAVPSAVLLALAAVLHLTRRHDLTLARGTDATKRQAAVVAPQAEAAIRRGTDRLRRSRSDATSPELYIFRPDGEILVQEWQAYADQAGDLRLEGAIEHTDPLTGLSPRTQAAWLGHPQQRPVTFHYAEGVIAGRQADEATLARMRQIAAALGAGLQSSDGRFGESPGSVAKGGLPGRR